MVAERMCGRVPFIRFICLASFQRGSVMFFVENHSC